MKLGVNIDHAATLRQARGTSYPDPVQAALGAQGAGCDSIVVHLREDRRHIQECDVFGIKQAIKIPLNLEMSINKNIVAFAENLCPDQATLVPERRQELTTEGGIDVIKHHKRVYRAVKILKAKGIKVSLFIDPARTQVKAAKDAGADTIEFNTGRFSEARSQVCARREINNLSAAAAYARKAGFSVAAGHGLDYNNVKKIITIGDIEELNIGHAIISQAILVGIRAAVVEMIRAIKR